MGDEKYLIIHMDDMGMSYAANKAGADLFEKGIVTSASVMAPCAWACDFVKWWREHPRYDVGLHLTFTCEWDFCRWPSITAREKVPGMLDGEGFLWRKTADVLSHASVEQLELEMKNQMRRLFV